MILFYLLVSVMPLLKHPLWSEVVGDITVIKYLGVACLIYALVYLPMRKGSAGFLSTWQARFFVAFALLVSVLYLQAGNPELTIEISPLMSFVSFLVFFFVTLTVVDSVERLRWVLLTTVGSVAYASLHIIREWQKYGGMAAGYRPGYVTGDPNYFSVSALLCLPISIYLLRTKQPTWERNFCIASIVVTMLALTFAASRGGFVGLAAAALVMALHSKRRVRTLLIVVVLTLPLMMIAPSSPLTRILSPDQHDIYSADHRAELAKAGMRMFMAYPLTGIGPGNFKPLLDQFATLDEKHIAHNTYVQIMAEMGLPGIVLFCAVVIATFVSLHRVRTMMRDSPHQIFPRAAEALQTGLAGFLASAYFLTAEHHRLFWFIIFLAAVLHQLAVQVVAAEAPPAPRRLPRRRVAAEIGSPS